MFSTFLDGCSVSRSLAKTLVLWFTILRTFHARALASSSISGEEVDRIGVRISRFGVMNKRLSGRQWDQNVKKSFADVVRSPPVKSPPSSPHFIVFRRLSYRIQKITTNLFLDLNL